MAKSKYHERWNAYLKLYPQKERGFNCMRLITFLTNDGVTEWEQWHGAHLQSASGHCPYSSECPNYKQTVEKYINPY